MARSIPLPTALPTIWDNSTSPMIAWPKSIISFHDDIDRQTFESKAGEHAMCRDLTSFDRRRCFLEIREWSKTARLPVFAAAQTLTKHCPLFCKTGDMVVRKALEESSKPQSRLPWFDSR